MKNYKPTHLQPLSSIHEFRREKERKEADDFTERERGRKCSPSLSAAALSGTKNVLDCLLDFVCAYCFMHWLTL